MGNKQQRGGYEQLRGHRGTRRSKIETYTRYSRVNDEEQKKVLGFFNGNFETYYLVLDIMGKNRKLREPQAV